MRWNINHKLKDILTACYFLCKIKLTYIADNSRIQQSDIRF